MGLFRRASCAHLAHCRRAKPSRAATSGEDGHREPRNPGLAGCGTLHRWCS